MRSDTIKKGFERAPHRSLLRATGSIESEADWDKPFIAICNSYTDCIPGHAHLNEVGMLVKRLVREAGGVPFIFNTIGVDDGIAMGHGGMKYSLPSRELIADCVETMVRAHCFDGMVCIPNCDKIVPGMLMAAMRLNIPTVFVSGGPMAAGIADSRPPKATSPAHLQPAVQKSDLISVFKGVGELQAGKITDERPEEARTERLPDLRLVLRHVHRQLDELPLRGARHGAARQRHHPGRLQGARSALRARRPRHHQAGRARTSSRATSPRWKPSTTPSRSTWPWAARPTPSSTRWPSRARRASPTTSSALTTSRAACRACARCRRRRTTTCRTCIAPAASTPSSANSSAWARSLRPARPSPARPSARTLTNGTCARRNAPPGPRPSRVAGCSALVLDPNDKLGPAARTASGNLAPKPMLFFPGDPRGITLWRLAAAFNAGDAAAAAALFAEDARVAGGRDH